MSLPSRVAAELYPFASNILQLGPLRYHYLDEGSGDPLVLLHGNPSWSFMYRRLVQALRDDYRLIVPDHIGCGLSDKPDDSQYRYTLESRVDDLERLIDSLQIERRLTLIMHDWGGVIGSTYATRHPQRIARLVILNTAAFLPLNAGGLHWTIRWCRDSRLLGYLIRRFNLFAAGASVLACRKPLPRAIRRGYTAPYDSWDNRIATLRFVQDIPLQPGDDAWEALQETTSKLHLLHEVPMAIFWGEKDFVFDLDFLSQWQERFPNAEVHRFPDAGHYVLEDAGEKILPRVRSFLERHPLEVA